MKTRIKKRTPNEEDDILPSDMKPGVPYVVTARSIDCPLEIEDFVFRTHNSSNVWSPRLGAYWPTSRAMFRVRDIGDDEVIEISN